MPMPCILDSADVIFFTDLLKGGLADFFLLKCTVNETNTGKYVLTLTLAALGYEWLPRIMQISR